MKYNNQYLRTIAIQVVNAEKKGDLKAFTLYHRLSDSMFFMGVLGVRKLVHAIAAGRTVQ